MSDYLFISYAYRDRMYAHELASRLDATGYRSWLFERDEVPAEPYRQQLMEVIADALAVVVILSARSIVSRAVEEEIDYAKARMKRIIPVQIEPCPDGPVRFQVGSLNWIDAQIERYPVEKIAAALGYAMIESPPVAYLSVIAQHRAYVHPAQIALRIPTHVLIERQTDEPREHTICTIGTYPDSDMTIKRPETKISRRHAHVCARWLPDVGWHFLLYDTSKNGTYINGSRMTSVHQLREGDTIGLVREQIVLEFGLLDETKTVSQSTDKVF